jgi:hypothetical protein
MNAFGRYVYSVSCIFYLIFISFPLIPILFETRLVTGGIPAGHFSHLFIDESGHAVEPEALIPIAGLFTTEKEKYKLFGQLVLAGDPKQLGPLLRSPVAIKLGLGGYLVSVYFHVFFNEIHNWMLCLLMFSAGFVKLCCCTLCETKTKRPVILYVPLRKRRNVQLPS